MLCLFALVWNVFDGSLLQAEVAGRPFWTEQAMFRFGDDLFFAGRASCAPSAEEGRQRAYNAALQEIINYTRTREITGISIETQMIYEEENTGHCREGHVSIWRLLRAPASRLEKLNRMAAGQAASVDPRTVRSVAGKQVRDMTPKIGLYKDDAFELFGQPRTMSIPRRGGGEASWDYPKFGLTLVFDANGYLIGWKQAGPGASQQGEGLRGTKRDELADLEGSIDRVKAKKGDAEAIDLSKRLEKMQQESLNRREETDAVKYCERAYSRDVKLQDSCIQYEIDKQRRLSSPDGYGMVDAERIAKALCTSRWSDDRTLQESCQRFERDRLLRAQRNR